MTTAPKQLLAARTLLLDHLGRHGLAAAAVGVVGDAAHRGGYHCGRDRVVSGDYSVVESARDRNGLTLDAAALDIGTFSVKAGGKTHNLRTFSSWLVKECRAGAKDTADIREVIYSTDGKTVRRWDRLGIRSSGDSSHLWHTHISYFRDAIKAGRDLAGLFRRYLTEIGLIEAASKEDDVTPEDIDKIVNAVAKKVKAELPAAVWGADIVKNPSWRPDAPPRGKNTHVQTRYAVERLLEGLGEIMAALREQQTTLVALTQAQAGVPADEILADDPAALTRIAEAIEQIASGPTSGTTAPRG